MIIQNLDEEVALAKEKSIEINIASDFHYNNTEGKMTVPWFDYVAFVQIKNKQKTSIRYSVIQQNDETISDKVEETEEEIVADQTEASLNQTMEIVKTKRRTFKRRRRRRKIQEEPPDYQLTLPEAKDNSLFNYLREVRNSLKPYYLLSNDRASSNKPKEQKYIRVYLPTPTRRIVQNLEFENADYNHELEVMAYVESEDNQTDWKEAEKLSVQDSSLFLGSPSIEIPATQQNVLDDSTEENNEIIEPRVEEEKESSSFQQAEDNLLFHTENLSEIIEIESGESTLGDLYKDTVSIPYEDEQKNRYLFDFILILKNVITYKEMTIPSSEENIEELSLDRVDESVQPLETTYDSITKPSINNQSDNLVESSIGLIEEPPTQLMGELTTLETDYFIEEKEVENRSNDEMEEKDTEHKDIEQNDQEKVIEEPSSLKGPVSNLKTKTIQIPISTYVHIDDFLHPALFGSAKQVEYNFLPYDNKSFPLLDTVFLDSMYFFQEELYCRLIGYKVHEIIFSAEVQKKHNLLTSKKTIYESQATPRHYTNDKGERYPLAVHIKVPVIVGEYDIEISLKRFLDLEKNVVNIKELSRDIKLTTCKFIPSSFRSSKTEGVHEATSGKLFIEGTITQRIEYKVLSEEEDKKLLNEDTKKIQQNAVIELILELLQVQKVYYPSNYN